MIGIYKITNPNNEVYIGQSINIKGRISQHKSKCSNKSLKDSFDKYGFENHKIEVICECDFSELKEKEKFFIDLYLEDFTLFNSHLNPNVRSHKKKPKEQHKQRIIVFIPPEMFKLLTVKECQNIAKTAIKKEYRKRLKNKEK